MMLIVGISCFAVGVYAGRKRAAGFGWITIVKDFCMDTKDVVIKTWSAVSAPFRKGSPEAVKGEIVR